MSRPVAWWAALVLAVVFWVFVGLGAKAIAAPVTDAPQFLERRGLHANPVPLVVVPDGHLSGKTTAGSSADGAAYEDHIAIEQDVVDEGGLRLAHVALHEYLHQASMWRWAPEDYDDYWTTVLWAETYEEGLVEAVTIDLLPNFWRYVTGKRLRAWLQASYFNEVISWRVWSSRAVGKSWRSKEARQWRVAALTWGPAQRMEAVNALTRGNP